MYITLKERENKRGIKTYYIYVCESKRVEGKVVNKQRYAGSVKETELKENDYSFLMELVRTGKWTSQEVYKIEDKLKAKASELHDMDEV